jgi:antitoxin YefM
LYNAQRLFEDAAMRTVSYSQARRNFSATMDAAIDDRAPVRITRQRGGDCVLLSLEDYEAMEETAYLLRSPANAAHLPRVVEDFRKNERRIAKCIEELETMESGDADVVS